MKKFLLMVLFIACCMSVNAQVTYNIRVGGGIMGTYEKNKWYHYDEGDTDTGFGFNAQVQCNIPFQRGSQWTFSPSVTLGVQLDDDHALQLYAPLQVGYKVPMGNSSIFFPKFGAALGYEIETESAIVGPTVSLDFEIKHFVVGLNAFYSIKGHNHYFSYPMYGAYINFGYKF